MSEGGEKTEQPTPKKERDAREKGQVARSQEVVSAGSLMAVIGYLWMAWGDITGRLAGLFDVAAQLALDDFRIAAANGLTIVAHECVRIFAPVAAVTIIAGIATNVLQFGIVMSLQALSPKLDKISPAAGFKRIFSMKQIVETLKSVLKIVILTILLWCVLRTALGPFTVSIGCGLFCQTNLTATVLFETLMYSGLAFLIVALADFVYQKRSHIKSLMMSKDEVKREYKESEGDPHIKGKRKQLAHELLTSQGGSAARRGTAVVVNPTHLAVVLRYDEKDTPVPVVTAKGRNLQAATLRAEAEDAGVPIFRNVQLARRLYADAVVGEVVPDELLDAVAEVLAWVARHRVQLYGARLPHGVIDMEAGDHRASGRRPAAHAPR